MYSHTSWREKCLSSWKVHVCGVEVLVGSHLHSSVVHVMRFSRQFDRKIVTESLQRCSLFLSANESVRRRSPSFFLEEAHDGSLFTAFICTGRCFLLAFLLLLFLTCSWFCRERIFRGLFGGLKIVFCFRVGFTLIGFLCDCWGKKEKPEWLTAWLCKYLMCINTLRWTFLIQ